MIRAAILRLGPLVISAINAQCRYYMTDELHRNPTTVKIVCCAIWNREIDVLHGY